MSILVEELLGLLSVDTND